MFKSVKIEEKIKIEKIFSIFESEYTKNYAFAGERHNFWECVYVVRGEVNLTADGRVFRLSAGEAIFHKPLEFHKLSVDAENGVKVYIFSFSASGELCCKIDGLICSTNSYQNQLFRQLFTYIKEEEERYSLIHGKEDDKNIRWFRTLENPIVAQTVATYISQIILSVYKNTSLVSTVTERDAEIFRQAVEKFNDNIDMPISVLELAKSLCISESTLKRIFKKYTDDSVHHYFLMLKIQKATQLLKEGYSVFEVSERLGFSSQAYFSVCFKRETGKNPSEI